MFPFPFRKALWLLPLAFFLSDTGFAKRFRADFAKNPAKAVGRLRLKNQECTAFLSGPGQITTAAHCIQFGLDDANFQIQYENGKYAAESKIKGLVLTGGGFDPDDQLRGTDWAHLQLETRLGDTYGWIDLSNDDTPTGLEIAVVSYMANWYKGEYAGYEECVVKDPPEQAKKFCRKVGDNDYSCNFFAHDCELDRDGMDSGAPLVSKKTGKAVGILTGQGHIGTRVFNWGLTVNESADPAANVFFHWINMRNYVAFDLVASRHGTRNVLKKEAVPANDLAESSLKLVSDWKKMSEWERVREIQKWDTVEGQWALFALFEQYFEQYKPQMLEKYWLSYTLDTKKVPDQAKVREGKKTFGPWYAEGKKAYSLAYRTPPKPKQIVAVKTYLTSPSSGTAADDVRRAKEIMAEVEFLESLVKQNRPEYADYIKQRAGEMKEELPGLARRIGARELQNRMAASTYVPQPTYQYYIVPTVQVQYYQPVYYYYVPVQPVYYYIR